jgi:hypothetical protein
MEKLLILKRGVFFGLARPSEEHMSEAKRIKPTSILV